MIIRSVHLENIKSYVSASFTFTEGVNAIVGRNGAGKSTVVEAIGFALFDAGSGRALVRQGAPSGQVTVGFDSGLDGRRYNVVRRTSSTWYVHDVELGTRLHTATADVSAFLREHMGLSRTVDLSKVFEDAVGVAQGSVTAIFLRPHSQRKAVFDPLLEVDEYDTAFSNLLDARNLARERQAAIENAHARITGILEKAPEVEARLAQVRAELAECERSHTAAASRAQAAAVERQQWDERRRALEAARERHAKAETAHERAELLNDSAQRALAEAERAHAIVHANRAGYDAYLAAREERTLLEGKAQQRQQLLVEQSSVTAAWHKAQDEIARAETELEEIADNEMIVAQLESEVAREEELRAQLDAARRDQQQIVQQQQTRTRLQQMLTEEIARLETLRAEAASATLLQQQITQAETVFAQKRAAMEALSNEMSAKRAVAETVKQQTRVLETAGAVCPVCEKPLTADHQHTLVQRNQSQLAALRDEWGIANQRHQQLEEEAATLESEIKRLSRKLAALPGQSAIDQVQRYVDDLREQEQAAADAITACGDGVARIPALQQELAALGEPRVRRGMAQKVVARRAAVEATLTKEAHALENAAQRKQEIEQALATFSDLDERMQEVVQSEGKHQVAWQQVIGNQAVAEQLPLRQEAAHTGAANVAKCAEDLESAAADLAAVVAQWDETRAEAARVAEGEAQAEVRALASRMEYLGSDLERLVAEQTFLQEQEKERVLLNHELDSVMRQREVIDTMRTVIKAAGPQITRALIGQVGAYAAQWFGELTGDFTRRLNWDEEYAITLEENGRDLDFKSLSGGEQMAAALSVRLALLRELGSIDIAFFDEPTAHLDADRREALAKQIMQVKGFRQIFVISHDDTFEHQTDNVIHVERHYDGSKVLA